MNLGLQSLAHAAIAQRIPHSGRMCLLDRLESWSPDRIHCTAIGHADALNPLRTTGGLLGACAIEYAAQAMALHGAMLGDEGGPPTPGYLASVRSVRLFMDRLDTVAGALQISAERSAGNDTQILYQFTVADASGRLLAEGRAVVVLNTPVPTLPGLTTP